MQQHTLAKLCSHAQKLDRSSSERERFELNEELSQKSADGINSRKIGWRENGPFLWPPWCQALSAISLFYFVFLPPPGNYSSLFIVCKRAVAVAANTSTDRECTVCGCPVSYTLRILCTVLFCSHWEFSTKSSAWRLKYRKITRYWIVLKFVSLERNKTFASIYVSGFWIFRSSSFLFANRISSFW